MSNHVHYLLEPARPEDVPKIMHWLNWYTAMCFNRILHRSGHFWEKRYHSSGFPVTDRQRALNTLRYIHANPRAAGVRQGYFYDFSNYGSYDQLTDDGLTQWHPAFLELGSTLDECAARYPRFCKAYHLPAKEKATNTRLREEVAGRDIAPGPPGWSKGPSGSAAALDRWFWLPRAVPGIGQLARAVGGADLHRGEPIRQMDRFHLTAHRPLPVSTAASDRADNHKRNRSPSQAALAFSHTRTLTFPSGVPTG